VDATSRAASSSGCSRYAGPSGSDGAPGTARRPFRTVQRLANSLRPQETGCLLPGTYIGNVRFGHGGRAGRPITVRSASGRSATIVGRIWIPKGSNRVILTQLRLVGTNPGNLPSPTVDSDNDVFIGNDVTDNHTGVCFALGSAGGYGQAVNTLIERNRIHDCGVLPPMNHDHGIYVANSIGARIVHNIIYNNADRGIQLYWNAQWTTIAGNIIDHNGEGIDVSGDFGYVSSHNTIVDNIITNSTEEADVGSYWPSDSKGVANIVTRNCIYGGTEAVDRTGGGFAAFGNLIVDPHYADVAAANYSVPAKSVCASLLAKAG